MQWSVGRRRWPHNTVEERLVESQLMSRKLEIYLAPGVAYLALFTLAVKFQS